MKITKPEHATLIAIVVIVALLAGLVIYNLATHRPDPPRDIIISEEGFDPGPLNDLGASLGCDLQAYKGELLFEVMRRLRACQEREGHYLPPRRQYNRYPQQ